MLRPGVWGVFDIGRMCETELQAWVSSRLNAKRGSNLSVGLPVLSDSIIIEIGRLKMKLDRSNKV